MIRQSLMPEETLRDWKVQPVGGIFGESAEGKKVPKDVLKKCEDLGDSAEGIKRSPRLSLWG